MYAEQREKPAALLTRYPVVTIGEVVERYAAFPCPINAVREKTSLEEALRTLAQCPVDPRGDSGSLRASEPINRSSCCPRWKSSYRPNEIEALADSAARISSRGNERRTFR